MYEIAYLENGEIVRGGIKATRARVNRWIRMNTERDPEHEYFAIEADEHSITYEEYLDEIRRDDLDDLDEHDEH